MDRTREMTPTGRAVLVAPMVHALAMLAEWGRRQQIRKTYGRTSELLLRDIGLTPDDIVDALGQPLDRDASDALLMAARARHRNW